MSLRSLLKAVSKERDEDEADDTADTGATDTPAAGTDPDPEDEDENDGAASAEAEARGRSAGIAAERKRWTDVLGSEDAEGRIELAVVSLSTTDNDAKTICGLLKAAAKAGSQQKDMKRRLEQQENPDTGRPGADIDDNAREAMRQRVLAKVKKSAPKGKKG